MVSQGFGLMVSQGFGCCEMSFLALLQYSLMYRLSSGSLSYGVFFLLNFTCLWFCRYLLKYLAYHYNFAPSEIYSFYDFIALFQEAFFWGGGGGKKGKVNIYIGFTNLK